ncbi:hypothetical protein ElyMa_004610900 [Elysia marginata]|uniref:Uncharacterized protein n=1 Tax=Elysia marginata TaxID=1093978 RepID=A0AAV4HYT7_9GAST|nr:hypothetical protein ElyMa_004610900 [Elysia marginata]
MYILTRSMSFLPSLQRYRTAENLRLSWENPGGPQRRQNQLFSWDDDFWKTTSRKSPQSVASSASTFEEVESLCFSRSSSDSFNSSLRLFDNRYSPSVGWAGSSGRHMWMGGGGGGTTVYPGRVGTTAGSSSSRRQRISRQSSTTSTSTSRSSAGAAAAGGDDELAEYQRRFSQDSYGRAGDVQSITGKLIDSIEFLGSRGNLDAADKLYLEKIFHRVVGQSQTPQDQPLPLKSALKKQRRNYEQSEMLSGNEALLERLQRLQRKQLLQRESGSAPASATSSPVLSAKKDNFEKKRRKDLIIPDEEEPQASKRPQWNSASERYNLRRGPNDDRFSGSTNRHQTSDSYSKSSMVSSVSSISMENGSLRASPVGSISPASPNNLPEQHPNLATFLSVNPTMQRIASIDSTATGSASEGAINVFAQPFSPSHAERVLMGLGFGAAEGFLPERFLKDWYNKISRAHSESNSGTGRGNSDTAVATNNETKDAAGRGLHHGKSVGQFEPGNINRYQAATGGEKSGYRPQHLLQRHDSHVSSISSILDEAASYLPKGGDLGSRNERIGDYIVAHSPTSSQMPQGGPLSSRVNKMRQFATARQKSLPLHLETLTEEDELRIRKSGFDPFDKEARLQMFISDTMSSSGKSTTSEQSRCGSNQSESDSLSSCSEMIDAHVKLETPEWQQTSAYRKQQEQIPPQLQQTVRQPKRRALPHTEQKNTDKVHKRQSSNRKRKEKLNGAESVPEQDLNENGQNLNLKHDLAKSYSRLEVEEDKVDQSNCNDVSEEKNKHDQNYLSAVKNANDYVSRPKEPSNSVAKYIGNKTDPAMQQERIGTFSSHKTNQMNQSISITSGDSLEVADIMQFGLNRSLHLDGNLQNKLKTRQEQSDTNSISHLRGAVGDAEVLHKRNPPLKSIEPAMVSIVLEDVDQDSDGNRKCQELATLPQEGNHLNIPLSRCSSSSLSPIPQSPVTVIEVGQLDNQQDSLDTEGTASSKETDDEVCSENSGKSKSGGKTRHNRQEHKLRLSPTSQKLLEKRRGSSQLPQLSINDKPLEQRRFSLDVPTVARLRRISEERLRELNNHVSNPDNEDDNLLPCDLSKRRGSARRASFSEEKPIIINDFLASKNSSRSPSPHRKKSYLIEANETNLESSHRKRGKARDHRLSRSVSPSKSPSSPLSLTPTFSMDRENQTRRHSKHRQYHSHVCHHQAREGGENVYTVHNMSNDRRPHNNLRRSSYDMNDHDTFEKQHCCCCQHRCCNSKPRAQEKDDHHYAEQLSKQKHTPQSSGEAEIRPLDKQTPPVHSKNKKPADSKSNVQVHQIPKGIGDESPSHSAKPFLTVIQNEKQFSSQTSTPMSVPRSIESSPGSSRSAFTFTGRSGSKGNLSMPGGSDYQSETDVDEFPSTVKLTLNQRPISNFTKNILLGANPFRRNSSSSSLVSLKGNGFNPNILFSSSPKKGSLSDEGDNFRNAVHTISRAVQASGSHSNDPGQICLSHSLNPLHAYYFLAKDKGTQCSEESWNARNNPHFVDEHNGTTCMSCSHAHQQTKASEHVHVFDKFTQTGVTCYEVSSQTEWVGSHISSTYTDTSLSVKTGPGNPNYTAEEDFNRALYRHSGWNYKRDSSHKQTPFTNSECIPNNSNKDGSFFKFNVIDETIELIEAELLHIDNRHKQKPNKTLSPFQDEQATEIKELAFPKDPGVGLTLFPKQFEKHLNPISVDKRVPERYAPSSWRDATRMSPYSKRTEKLVSLKASVGDSENKQIDSPESFTPTVGTKTNFQFSFDKALNQNFEAPHKSETGKLHVEKSSLYPECSKGNEVSVTSSPLNYQKLRAPFSDLHNGQLLAQTTICTSAKFASHKECIEKGTPPPDFVKFNESQVKEEERSSKSEEIASLKKSNQSSPARSYPTVDSKDLIVKMYELQQDLASYLKPCNGMYTENDTKIFQENEEENQNIVLEKENTEPVLSRLPYDFSIENANTSSGFSSLVYGINKAKRRFSTPAVCDGAHWARTHSKLSRLKYQNNSHQNSLNSLDIEVDFMNAGEPLGLPLIQKTKDPHIPSNHEDTTANQNDCISKTCSQDIVLVSQSKSIASRDSKMMQNKTKDRELQEVSSSRPSRCQEPAFHINDWDQEKNIDELPIHNSLYLLSPSYSACSSNNVFSEGRNTPEIVISPLGSAHTAFLTVPNSPKHLLLKARFPSVSSSPSNKLSPSRHNGCEKNSADNLNSLSKTSYDTDILTKDSDSDMKKTHERNHFLSDNKVHSSVPSSVQESSTLGSLTDLSNMSSLDKQSTSDFSKTSMYPHLSVESLEEFVGLSTLNLALDELNARDIGMPDWKKAEACEHTLKLRRLSQLNDQGEESDHNEMDFRSDDEDVDIGTDSNASLAGSDECKDVDDMEVMMHQSRLMRQNSSSSTYSEPDIDLIDAFSDDSLPSSLNDEMVGSATRPFLAVSRMSNLYADDLLQVSDYGGHSPIPSPRASITVASSPDSLTSASACRPDTHEAGNLRKCKNSVPLQRRVLQKAFSESWLNTDYHKRSTCDEDTEIPDIEVEDNGEESDAYEDFLQHQRRKGSKDNWDIVQALIDCHDNNRSDQSTEKTNGTFEIKKGENEIKSMDVEITIPRDNKINRSGNVSNYNDDSSGDECDKEITRINHSSFSLKKRSKKTCSDPSESSTKEICQTEAGEVLDETKSYAKTDNPIQERCKIAPNTDKNVSKDEGNALEAEEVVSLNDGAHPTQDKSTPLNQESFAEQPKSDISKSNNVIPGDFKMLEVFQNADLSVLKSAAGLEVMRVPEQIPVSSPQQSQKLSSMLLSGSELDCGDETSEDKSNFIPRIVGLEFSSDEEGRDQFLMLSDTELSSAISHDDLDSGLTEDLELVLSKSGDEFDELTNSLLVKDAISPCGPGLLHTPLSQITEEDTQSDCSLSEASSENRLKIWQVRDRFVYPDVGSARGTIVRLPQRISEEFDESSGNATPTLKLKETIVKDLPKRAVCSPGSQGFDNTNESPLKNTPTGGAFDDLVEKKTIFDSSFNFKDNTEVELKRNLKTVQSQSCDNPMENVHITKTSFANGNNSVPTNKQMETASNLVFTRSTLAVDDQDDQPTTRSVSPKSGIFKFAQALLEDVMDKAQTEHAERTAMSEQNCSPLSKPDSSCQVLDTKTVEKTLDNVGTATTKVSSITVTKRLNFNVESRFHERTEKLPAEEKHVSTKTLQLGDYREAQKESEFSLASCDSPVSATQQFPDTEKTTDSFTLGGVLSAINANISNDKTPWKLEENIDYSKHNKNENERDDEENHDFRSNDWLNSLCKSLKGNVNNCTGALTSYEKEGIKQDTEQTQENIDGLLTQVETHEPEVDAGNTLFEERKSVIVTTIQSGCHHASQKPLLNQDMFSLKTQRDNFQEDLEVSVADLKARVTAMLLIDYGKDPGSTDSSHKDANLSCFENARSKNVLANTGSESSNASSSPLKRVKVTTMFSQASEDGGVAFMSSSIADSGSEAEKSPGSDLEDGAAGSKVLEDGDNVDTCSPMRGIRTQLPQSSGLMFRTQQSSGSRGGARGRKQLKSFRSRDSLLKLHQQTHVSSSAGSDSDSDFQSALRNQKQLRVKVKESDKNQQLQTSNGGAECPISSRHAIKENVEGNDRGANKKTQFLNVVPDRRRSRRKLGSPEPNRNNPSLDDPSMLESLSSTENQSTFARRFSSSSGSSLGNSTSNPPTPKVIIQQPSEDAPVFDPDRSKIFVFPSRISSHKIFSREKSDVADSNDNHLHSDPFSPTKAGESWSSGENMSMSPPVRPRGPWGLRAHRPKRPQFLSPNTAARPPRPVAFSPAQDLTYTRQNDPSHPELAYLDIVSRIKNMSSEDHDNPVRAPNSVSPPSIIKTEFTDTEKTSDITGSSPSLCLRNLGSPEPCVLNEIKDHDADETVERLDLFPPESSFYARFNDAVRPGLSVIISCDQSELDSTVPSNPTCEDDLEMSWPSKSLSVASKDSGFETQSQGSPSEMGQSHKFGTAPLRSIDIVREETGT